MCGIAGIIGRKDPALLNNMCNVLIHRGPDDAGTFIDDQVSLGMRRLKIIDLETGNQPISNEDKKIQVVFNGEIYNFKELRSACLKKGHRFYTKSDTEVLVHLYEDYGDELIHHLQGMFVFALYDSSKKTVLIGRDRLGIKPLYYRFDAGILYFGSELKSLVQDKSWHKQINFYAVQLFLKYLYIPTPHSIFLNAHKLPAGHILKWHNGNINIKRYWNLSCAKTSLPHDELIVQLQKLLKSSVAQRLISDVPLGVFLSGGLDSGSIVALMSSVSSEKINSFSIGYDKQYASYNETDVAKRVADHFGCTHEEYIVSPDAVDLVQKLSTYFDEPFADSSAIPTYLVSRLSRQKVTVALSGIGGDEIFGGYPRYQGIKLSQYYEKIPLMLRKFISRATSHLPESTVSSNISGRIKRFTRGGTMDILDRYMDWVTFDQAFFLKGLYSNNFAQEINQSIPAPRHALCTPGNSKDILDKVFMIDTQTYLIDDLLTLGDRMSMASSLELRVPFCDHRLVEFMASVPAHIRFPGIQKKSNAD
ncbi:MAG: asparagine synthase (glutamine-hydrolyzing) [bacterium]